MPNDDLIK